MKHLLTRLRDFVLNKPWTWMIVLLVLIATGVLTRETLYLKREIKEANHRAAISRMQAAMIEVWVHAQINFDESRLTDEEVQGVNHTYPPKVDMETVNLDDGQRR
jgi:hypothetical protein